MALYKCIIIIIIIIIIMILTGATFSENVHGGVSKEDLGGIHGAREHSHDDCTQFEHVPELSEVLALLFADLVDDVVQEVQDETDEDQLSVTDRNIHVIKSWAALQSWSITSK